MARTAREKVDDADMEYLRATVATLKARRLELGMSQTQVAELMGITQPGLSRIESLAVCPSFTALLRWARVVKARVVIALEDPHLTSGKSLTEGEVDHG